MTHIDAALLEVITRYVVNSEWASQVAPITVYCPDTADKRRYPCIAITASDVTEEPFTIGLFEQRHTYEIRCCVEQHTTADSYALAQELASKVKAVLRRQQLCIAPAVTTTTVEMPVAETLLQVEDPTKVGGIFYFDMPIDRLWRSARYLTPAIVLLNPVPYVIPAGTSVYSPRAYPFRVTISQERPQSNGLEWEATVNYEFSLCVQAPGALEVNYRGEEVTVLPTGELDKVVWHFPDLPGAP
jgi:hypothetical protein